MKSVGVIKHLPRLATMSVVTSNSTLDAPMPPFRKLGARFPHSMSASGVRLKA